MSPDRPVADQVVPPPETDRPALADPTTAALLTAITRRVRAATSGIALVPLLVLAFVGYVLLGSAFDPGFVLLTGVQLACIALLVATTTYAHLRYGRALPGLRRLLAEQAWRPAAATVRGTVVELADGTALRVPGMPDPVLEVIVRTGRVWLVGPDRKGWLALRVAGGHAPWPARGVRSPGGPVRRPRPAGSTGTAADDPVAAGWAAVAVRLMLLRLWPIGFIAVIFAVTAVGMGIATGTVTPWVVFAVVFVAPCLVILVVRLRRSREHRALPTLLRAGPWTRVDVRLRDRKARQDATADATGVAQIDGGTALEIILPAANIDLLGTIAATGNVWLAGEPAAGRTLAAGFPGYPLLGVARLS
jgi:hypothetical protein